MKMNTTLAVIALALTPTFAAAQACSQEKQITASSCGDGQTYDATTKSCVTAASS